MNSLVNGLPLHAELPPLRTDQGGAVRIGNSRISLDLVVEQYENGMTPEDMVRAYDTLVLADVYAVIAYYLRHRDEVRAYLTRREEEASTLRAKIEAERPRVSRQELLARRGAGEKGALMFSDDCRQRMRLGTSSKWAAELTDEDLQVVLWMVGEFGRRAPQVLTALDRYWAESPPQDRVASARAKLALEGLFRVVCGERPGIDEFFGRWGSIAERVWAAAHSRKPDLAPAEMGDRWPVMWKGHLVGWLKDPTHQLLGCTGLWVPYESTASEEFLVALGGSPSAVQVVTVGGIQSVVKEPPAQSGQVSVSWCPSG